MCDCPDCKDADKPYNSDCDVDSMCLGCRDNAEFRKEVEFEIDRAQGRI